VDDHGIHFSSGCNIDNMRTAIHDAMVLELESLIKYSGLAVAHEEKHKFQTHLVDSNNRTDTTIKRSEVLDLGKPFNEVIIDHSITCPLEGAVSGNIKVPKSKKLALTVGDAAEARYQSKFKHYKTLIENAKDPRDPNPISYFILPFVFETTGLLHRKCLDFLETLANHCEMTKKIPGISLLTFFKRRLACCLAKSLAHVINVRGNRMLSHVELRYDRSFDPRHVMGGAVYA
jgi:hypothetical protein